jgi:hypothetical protein
MGIWENSNVTSKMCMYDQYGIKAKPTKVTTINAQANSSIERVHKKVVNDILRSFNLGNNNENPE